MNGIQVTDEPSLPVSVRLADLWEMTKPGITLMVVLTAGLGYLLAALPIAGAGLYVGGRVQTGLSQRAFQIVIRVLLLVSGVALLLKG